MTTLPEINVPHRDTVVHSPTDALRFLTAALVAVSAVIFALVFPEAYGGLGRDIASALDQGTGAFADVAALAITVVVLAVPVILLVFFVRQRSLRQVLIVTGSALMAAAVTAGALAWLTTLLADHISPAGADAAVVAETAFYPYVAGLAAAISAASPWMSLRRERITWVTLGLLIVIRLAFGSNFPIELVLALAIGVASGAGVLFFAGSPNRRPTGEEIVEALRRSRIRLAGLDVANVDARGSTPYFAETVDGDRLFVKTLSTDERSAALLFRLYRQLRFKDIGDEPAFSTLRREVEHEALLSLSASAAGVRTPRLVTVGVIGEDEYSMILAYEALDGRSLDSIAADELTDDVLIGIWRQVSILRDHGIAHRDLRLANVFLDSEGIPWIIDFGFSELAASDLLLNNDIAELITSSALLVGAERAVRCALDALGPDAVAAATPRVQPEALSGATHSALTERSDGLDRRIREEIARATGHPMAPLDRVYRLRPLARLRGNP